MVKVVGVRFREAGQIYYFLGEANKTYSYNERVLVETDKNQQLGYVAIAERELSKEELPEGLKSILRSATKKDLEQEAQNIKDANHAFKLAKVKIKEHGLEMKLAKADYSFDRAKLMFQFTSDGRVDFRDLVRDLASEFRTRIELRQIGIRDEAKILGGIGPCGRPLCCSTFLGDFMPVSIKMAKDQNLSLNQTKISGLCGRLMCCLKYENDMYEEARRELPDYGYEVETPDGKGRVVGLNLLDRVIKVRLFGKEVPIDYDHEEIKVLAKGRV
ncbi:PSP1 domain-containing protein [Vagococcus xieshaowenii]|uniref:Signal peptidase n=1 Tax=Vagococcus xieshaowenii TaxID=2562451 RepID=A0AAJ5EFE9_9ENTE|nr:stage 0 sporulation family protein [Vagococcus xieshaowenii]QCA29091.1 signal peptidase [Vagococcus xieshaowenii]TFZ40933.1 signal peptidase [Vagococcus xieshaowenii]